MTSAWKLLYDWKSRGGRRSEQPADSDIRRPPRHLRDHGGRFHRRGDFDLDDRLPRVRNLCHRSSQTEHESVHWVDRSTVDLENNGNNGGISVVVANRVRLIRNSQLPEDVIQARERLTERLRNASLIKTREFLTSSGISVDEHAMIHDLSNNDFVHRRDETLRYLLDSNLQHLDYTLDEVLKKPCVLWETLSTLHLEIFRNSEDIVDMKAAPECCICLESFFEWDRLIKLHCNHGFHPACLEPWVRAYSECPYCRARIS